ncbi:hypothetical protein DFQ29_003596, partial [Apophysomyces sp. BC1021]
MQEVYDRLADHPSTAASVEGFQQFISAQFSEKHRIDEFNRHYRHRERRALQGSSRQMTMDVIADQVGGFYPNTSLPPVQNVLKQSKRARRRKRQQHRRNQGGGQRDQRRALVAYGDADLHTGTYKTYGPLPVK